jgi:hypothetical protein
MPDGDATGRRQALYQTAACSGISVLLTYAREGALRRAPVSERSSRVGSFPFQKIVRNLGQKFKCRAVSRLVG